MAAEPLRIQDFSLSEIYRRQGRRMDEWRVQSGRERTGVQLDADGYVSERAAMRPLSPAGPRAFLYSFFLHSFPSTVIQCS